MMTITTRPEWCTPGASVVLHWDDPIERVVTDTIERVLRRDVVTERGHRFQVNGASVVVYSGQGAWRRIVGEMYPAGSSEADLALARYRSTRARTKIEMLCRSSEGDDAVASAIAKLLPVLRGESL